MSRARHPLRAEGSRSRPWPLRPWLIFLVVFLLVAGGALHVAGLYARSTALASLAEDARADAGLKVALLRAVLERPRSLPVLLSLDRDVQDALIRPTPDNRDLLNRKLERLVRATNASVLYVLDASGMTIAASNWREPDSFVGSNYGFRPYFTGAMANGSAEHFALGSVSRRPGLYISSRVGDAVAPAGIVVVKTEFHQLEADWAASQRPVYVTDENGVVLITTVPSWRFMTTRPLSAGEAASMRESLQFGEAPLQVLPMSGGETVGADAQTVRAVLPGAGEADYLRLSLPAVSTAWRLEYLVPTEPAIQAGTRAARLATLLTLAPLAGLAALWLNRRQRSAEALASARAAREALERRVEERTADLSQARDRLQREIAEREAAEIALQGVQQDLVEANRLAILGQVAAGVAHEINQPVATIRAYADNARTFLERSQTQAAVENLEEIAGLTERIGTITDDLKALARKGRTAAEPVILRDVFEGAEMLLRSRFAAGLGALSVDRPSPDLMVLGNRLRLEQVFINLLQNALEAIEGRSDGRVSVRVLRSVDAEVAVEVADNGGGIPASVMAQLFTPFNSSKDKGLGLGLVIARDIVGDYGGRIEVRSDTDGTCFTVHLPKVGEVA